VVNHEELRVKRDVIRSITKLLCECDTLQRDENGVCPNEIILSIFSIFLQQIKIISALRI